MFKELESNELVEIDAGESIFYIIGKGIGSALKYFSNVYNEFHNEKYSPYGWTV